MKTILLLIVVVGLGWLAAVLAIALLILFASLVAGVVITFRSARGAERPKQTDRLRMKRLIEQEQT